MVTLVKQLQKDGKPVRKYLHALAQIIELDHARGWKWRDTGTLDRGESLDDDECALCRDASWWQDNYGSFWEEARWVYCGPLGHNCDYSEQQR